jgi:isoquinoline 1-oxidoreductase beta subunit
VGFWRSVGHSQNAFFSECFMDELAPATGKDPLLQVRELAVTKAGLGGTLPAGRYRGIAVLAVVQLGQGSFSASIRSRPP